MTTRWCVSGSPLGRKGRIWLLVLSGLLIAGFGVASSLSPDPRGYGTHQQLGLPPCTFQLLWNRPCPACGMTTCFAALSRGDWVRAFQANPAGVLLATICVLLIPWLWASAWRGETIGLSDPPRSLLWLMVIITGFTLSVWIQRLWF